MSVQVKEKLAECFVWGAALLTVGTLVIIIGYIMLQGLDKLSISFLLENPRRMGSEGGIFSPLLEPFISHWLLCCWQSLSGWELPSISLNLPQRVFWCGSSGFLLMPWQVYLYCDRAVRLRFFCCHLAAADWGLVNTFCFTDGFLYDFTHHHPRF